MYGVKRHQNYDKQLRYKVSFNTGIVSVSMSTYSAKNLCLNLIDACARMRQASMKK